MNAILGFAQLLNSKTAPPLSDRQSGYVKHILNAGDHLIELIDQVLDLAKIESGNMTIVIETVELHELCRECLILIDQQAKQLELSVECDLMATSNIEADYTCFRQVLFNLLSNAVKYNSKRGRVTLPSRDISNNRVRVEVTDRGEGIPRIFRPEFSTHSTGSVKKGVLSMARV